LIPEWLKENESKRVQQLIRNDLLEPYRAERLTKAGTVVEVWLTATALLDEAGQVYAIATSERAGGSNLQNLTTLGPS
jgi:two-component system CheB/CheR fusion protein